MFTDKIKALSEKEPHLGVKEIAKKVGCSNAMVAAVNRAHILGIPTNKVSRVIAIMSNPKAGPGAKALKKAKITVKQREVLTAALPAFAMALAKEVA